MKKIIFAKAGKPSEVLELQEVALPEPKPGEVRVKVKAANINPADLMFIQNLYGIRPQFPDAAAGFEGMGIIDAVGEGVSFAAGTRVSFTSIGAWAEYAITSAKACMPLPESISDDIAAQFVVNPFTAVGMVQESGVKAGEYLLLTAAGSAFSQMVIQLCKMQGIKTIGTVRRNDLTVQLKALGADEIVNTEEKSIFKEVMKLTDGKGVSCVLDAIAGKAAGDVLPCLAFGGKMITYGALSLEPIPVNSGLMIFKNLTITGFWLTAWMQNQGSAGLQQAYQNLISLFSEGKLQLPVEAKYELRDFKKAIEHFEKPGRGGKILLINP
jgi:NADPH:quinone reductase-like Zn-dependent oxidoreductase